MKSGRDTIEYIVGLFRERGSVAYFGESVSQCEHSLQAAWAAEKEGAAAELIVAALLHDVGHLLHPLPEDCAQKGMDDRHEELGAQWIERHFGPAVSEPVRLHVSAKRFLCATDPSYLGQLSAASRLSLRLQGGPFSPDQLREFTDNPHSAAAVRLRRWDEEAKVPGLRTPDLDYFRRYLELAQSHADA